jgi:hypothetical protein
MATQPLPPVPQLTSQGFEDPVWARWLNLLRQNVASSLTSLIINTANGFSGTVVVGVSGTVSVSIFTTVTGLLKGNGSAISAAVAGTDYVHSVSVTAPITNSGTAADPNISITQSSGTTNGYLSSTDWSTFNNKIGSVASGTGITVNTAGTTATINLTSPVSVANGGTGLSTLSQYNVLLGNAASSLHFAAPGASGTILASNGVAADPTFQTKAALAIASSGVNTDITSLASPTILTPNITGVTNGTTSAAGSIGELLTNSASGVSLTTGTPTNLTALTLQPGDYLVWGNIQFLPAAGTTQTALLSGFNSVSATLPASPFFAAAQQTFGVGLSQTQTPPFRAFTVNAITTINLVGQASFSGGTETANANIFALRFH